MPAKLHPGVEVHANAKTATALSGTIHKFIISMNPRSTSTTSSSSTSTGATGGL
jgi:hypothetical protein